MPSDMSVDNISDFANKRSDYQKERDYVEVSELYLRGISQAAIADRLSADPQRGYTLSRQQIAADLKKIQRRWRESCLRDFDELKAEQLAKIDTLEATYWDGWERSKAEKQRSTTKRKSTPVSGKAVTIEDEVGIIKEQQVGDPRFLAGVENCIDKRCKLIGLYAPEKIEITDPAKSGESALQTWLARAAKAQGLSEPLPATPENVQMWINEMRPGAQDMPDLLEFLNQKEQSLARGQDSELTN